MRHLHSLCLTWFELLNKKKILSKTVFERIGKEQLLDSALNDPVIRTSIERLGYYEVAHEITPDKKEILDELVKLGYIEKRTTRVHKVWLDSTSYLYYPDVTSLGRFVLNLEIRSGFKYVYMEDDQLKAFQKSIERFQKEMSIGYHSHVKSLNYEVEHNYQTDIYELKDRYFDAILLRCFKDELRVALVEPYIVSRIRGKKLRYYKKYQTIREINGELFFKGSNAIDKYISELDWKKKIDGYLIIDDVVYLINPKVGMEKPSLLDNYPIIQRKIENWYANGFERAVADFLQERCKYDYVKIHYRPPYLKGKELDVYAMKFGEERVITLAECKLRVYDENKPITFKEVKRVEETMRDVENYEKEKAIKEGCRLKINKWIFTNAKMIEKDARELLKKFKIKVKRTELPSDWLCNPMNLKIIKIEDLI